MGELGTKPQKTVPTELGLQIDPSQPQIEQTEGTSSEFGQTTLLLRPHPKRAINQTHLRHSHSHVQEEKERNI